jgi:HK97 family phage prohead protease
MKDNYVIKSAHTPFAEMDDKSGMLIGYANVYDIEDLQGDISQVGSFIKTVTENKSKIKIYKNHNREQLVGIPFELDANDPVGLRLTAKMIMDTDLGRDAYYESKFLVENGFESGFSIGGWVMKRSKTNKKIVTEYKLNEVSILTSDPANQLSMVELVKSVQQEEELTQAKFWETITKAYDNTKFSDNILKSLEEFLSLNAADEPIGEITHKVLEPTQLITDIYNLYI